VDKKPPDRLVLVVRVGAQTRDHLFKACSEWKAQQKILWAEVRGRKGEGEELVQDPGPLCRREV
jgi:hypothetical protein